MEITSRSVYLILKSLQRCLYDNVEFSVYMSKTNQLSVRKQYFLQLMMEISVTRTERTAFFSGFS